MQAINDMTGKRLDNCQLEFFYAMSKTHLNVVCVVLDEEEVVKSPSIFSMYLGPNVQTIHLPKTGDKTAALAQLVQCIKSPAKATTNAFTVPLPNDAIPSGAQARSMPDGSTVTLDVNGGHLKILPNGIKIRQYSDGSTQQTNPNGIVIDTNADESLVVQTNPDGTKHVTNKYKQVTSLLPDGTILRDFNNGYKRQDSDDGVSIATFPNGTKVQIDWNSLRESTFHVDGKVGHVDDANATRLQIRADGKMTT